MVKDSSITVLDASIKMAFKLFGANSKLKRELQERTEMERGLEHTRLELQKFQAKADETSRFAQSVIDTLREPLLSLDQDLRVVTISRSFCDFFKVKPEETIGRRTMLLNARQISQESGDRRIILLAMEDITERKEIERANKALLDRNSLVLKEVHHRIKNSMNTLGCLLQLQADSMSDPGAIPR